MSSPEKARDLMARGSAVLLLIDDTIVLGVGVVVTDGVRTGGSVTGRSYCRIGGSVCKTLPSLELIGGNVRIKFGEGNVVLPTASLMLLISR